MGHFNPGSVIVGLVVPFVAIVGGVAVLGQSQTLVFGMPVVYLWVFSWFVLTSVCLAAAWHFFDRKNFDEGEETSREATGGEEI